MNVTIGAMKRRSQEERVRVKLCALTREPRSAFESDLEAGILCSISDVYDAHALAQRAIASVKVATYVRHPEEDLERANQRARVSFVGTRHRHTQVTAEEVAKLLHCGLDTAQRTLKRTTQRGIRHALHPLQRRYRVDHLMLNRRRLNDTFYTDTLFSKVKSMNGNTCAQVYSNGSFTKVFPMPDKTGARVGQTLTDFADDVGIPDTLVMDLAPEQAGKHTEMQTEARRLRVRIRYTEKGRSEQRLVS